MMDQWSPEGLSLVITIFCVGSFALGILKGLERGKLRGRATGFEEGYTKGFEEGYTKGWLKVPRDGSGKR